MAAKGIEAVAHLQFRKPIASVNRLFWSPLVRVVFADGSECMTVINPKRGLIIPRRQRRFA